MSLRLTIATRILNIVDEMDDERTIAEIECLERILLEPDTRPLRLSDVAAANRRHDALLAHTPWFQLWQEYGVCCRVMRHPYP